MTRAELVEVLTVERFTPAPRGDVATSPSPAEVDALVDAVCPRQEWGAP